MKKIMLIITTIVCLCVCSSCADGKTEQGCDIYNVYDGVTFVRVSVSDHFSLYVQKETKVMYIIYDDAYQGGISQLIDENGKPLLYKGTLD